MTEPAYDPRDASAAPDDPAALGERSFQEPDGDGGAVTEAGAPQPAGQAEPDDGVASAEQAPDGHAS